MRRRVILFLMKAKWKLIPYLLAAVLLAGPGAALALDPAVLQSVVRIKPDWPLAQRGRDAAGAPRDPQGTGVAVLAGGYIATNVHVIGKATDVEVMTEDGRTLKAEIVGLDPMTDIALLKVPADLPVPGMADDPQLAAPVCAIGNQFGLGLSVTCGVVSALRRSGMGFNPIEDFIQTDAAVNPGGSGGALVDAAGRLVGMVSAIFTKQSDADIGVNFATSMPLLLRVVSDLKTHGRVIRGQAGFSAAMLPPSLAEHGAGVLVESVAPDGPALKAGLEAGDVITGLDTARIASPERFAAMMFMKRPGETVTLSVLRGSEPRSIAIVLGGM
jgi:S1-C subfamily serine protease